MNINYSRWLIVSDPTANVQWFLKSGDYRGRKIYRADQIKRKQKMAILNSCKTRFKAKSIKQERDVL